MERCPQFPKPCAYYGYANCSDVKSAEKLYTAGYRKASEVAMEVFEYLEEKGLLNIEVWAIQDVKAELKKKYTKEE